VAGRTAASCTPLSVGRVEGHHAQHGPEPHQFARRFNCRGQDHYERRKRINLGSRLAGQTVIVQGIGATAVRVTLAQVIPQRELWLHKDPKAKASILRELAQAEAGKVANSSPDLDRDAELLEWLED